MVLLNYLPDPCFLFIFFYFLRIFLTFLSISACVYKYIHMHVVISYIWSQKIHFLKKHSLSWTTFHFQMYTYTPLRILPCSSVTINPFQVIIYFFWKKEYVATQVNYFPISHLFTASFSLSDLMRGDRILFTTVSSDSHGWNLSSIVLACEEVHNYSYRQYKIFPEYPGIKPLCSVFTPCLIPLTVSSRWLKTAFKEHLGGSVC